MNKKEYYSDPKIVKKYENLRFINFGGQFVNLSECKIINDFNLNNKTVLDLPCGTGRLSIKILEKYPASKITCGDYSKEMLKTAFERLRNKVKYIEVDFFNNHIKEKYDFLFNYRFVFHYSDINTLFNQFGKLTNKKGFLVFDTLRWSPHKLLGHEIYIFSHDEIMNAAKNNGFNLIKKEYCFILPSRIYNYLPKLIIVFLSKLEKIWPKFMLAKNIWVFQKIR